MSRKEQDALVAYFNSFKLSKRMTTFEQLSDGKALMEVMSSIDPTHFKHITNRGLGISSPNGSSDNWVLRMNTLKRLYRLLLSFPLLPPHPQSLSLSTYLEPQFSSIAKTPTASEGAEGLLQICRLCLVVAVWGPRNEKVISKIQRLKEEHMAELMKSIEIVMSTLPADEETQEDRMSPLKAAPDISPPQLGIRAERDKLLQENDNLREQCQKLKTEIEGLTSTVEDVKVERDDALDHLSRSSKPASGLRTSQTSATTEVISLRADLARADDAVARSRGELDKQIGLVNELTKTVEDLKLQAAAAAKLRDQLDEYRHTAERLQKSENVIEKYKKKLEESAGLRRELRSLEEDNSALMNSNASLEAELKKALTTKGLLDSYRERTETQEKRMGEQAEEITNLTHQLELAQDQLDDLGREYEREQEELILQQEQLKEIELGAAPDLKRKTSVKGTKSTLDDELGVLDEEIDAGRLATKTGLRLRIRALQRELAQVKEGGSDDQRASAPEKLLDDAYNARDRYQAQYLVAHRDRLKLQATIEQLKSNKGGKDAETSAAAESLTDGILEKRSVDVPERSMQLESEVNTLKERSQKTDADAGGFEEAQRSYEAQIEKLQQELLQTRQNTAAIEKRYKLEQQLMLSAWHEVGSRTVRDLMAQAETRRSQPKPLPVSWLGRQRRVQDDATFAL
ncbi:hypothetical protein IAR55_003560 [Kwoniella newhampshirensis]|uniref:Protein-nucleus import-related protein n=1 Tax=Kwoniella newhampshirensis TaxID=1651941 RepID=A0AAW0YZB7_9TREE